VTDHALFIGIGDRALLEGEEIGKALVICVPIVS
jgi:hypothetical protein